MAKTSTEKTKKVKKSVVEVNSTTIELKDGEAALIFNTKGVKLLLDRENCTDSGLFALGLYRAFEFSLDEIMGIISSNLEDFEITPSQIN